ncbi:MAG: ABC transporter permease [Candidatus Thioglobus sp.]|jgi:branched-chain amino acid transport system substrate-binding protein|nr:MAG: ABC transporter permease [Candidatus Thioglobus sp.]|tara:strand:- start:120 stop:1436 length:1317 start_codon:yes stop_codon:yes gene_type:complete
MNLRKLTGVTIAAVLALPMFASGANAYELVIPSLDYRTGAYGPNGIPVANGYTDYLTMLNERDGGINGVKIKNVTCETGYNTKKGVECYEKIKNTPPSGALVVQPLSTGITYQLIPKASVDEVPIFSMGYGRTSAANGKVFPWVFNFPATYWSQATALVQYIADQEGGLDALKGKKIYLVYHNSAYGKEPLRTLEAMAEKFGYEFRGLPVDHPGQEQKATWLQIRKEKPDWVLMWGWGVMNQVAIKEAASIRYPMDHFIGVWWSGSENDVMPAGDAADGYLSGAFHAGGGGFPAHDDIRKYVYDKGLGKGDRDRIGEVLYNRGMVGAMWTTEAIRKAMEIHGTTEVTGKHVRDGFEALDVDEARLEELGLGGFTYPVKITCENHEGPGKVAVQQWDAKAKQWNIVSKFYEPLRDVTGPLIEADSAAYAAENNVTPRDC